MRRIDWIWIFFVIVAVGLVLSWGRTGQRLQNEPAATGVLRADRVIEPESPCKPLEAPCAALGRELALVLGPVAGADDLLALRLVAAGTDIDSEPPEVEWQAEGEEFTPQRRLASRRLQETEWLIALPVEPGAALARTPSLWIRLRHAGIRYAVRFPLRTPDVQ